MTVVSVFLHIKGIIFRKQHIQLTVVSVDLVSKFGDSFNKFSRKIQHIVESFLSGMIKNSGSGVRYSMDPSSDSETYNCHTYEDLRVTSKGQIYDNILLHHADGSCGTEQGQAEQANVLVL